MKTYSLSDKILAELRGVKSSVLLSLHINPDADSVGSNLALQAVLKRFGKTVQVISPEGIPSNLDFLPNLASIQYKDITQIDFSQFGMLVALDVSELQMIHPKLTPSMLPDSLKIIVIDHHRTNEKFGDINLVDEKAGSTGEVLYRLFTSWQVKITLEIATFLLTSICGDTGTFRFAANRESLQIASILMEKGASLAEINFNLYQRLSLSSLKLWQMVLENLKTEKYSSGLFVYSVLPHSVFESEDIDIRGAANIFLQSVEGTDFGILLTEERKGVIKGSLRARRNVDVSKIAGLFGGGGHKGAAGFRVEVKKSFEETVQKILEKIKNL